MAPVDLCSVLLGRNNHVKIKLMNLKVLFPIIEIIAIIIIILQVSALGTLESKESARHRGHFALFNCLLLRHSKHNGVQRVYCNQFPAKLLYGSICLELVMIRQQWCRQILFGMFGACSCSQPQHTLTPGPSRFLYFRPLQLPSCRGFRIWLGSHLMHRRYWLWFYALLKWQA